MKPSLVFTVALICMAVLSGCAEKKANDDSEPTTPTVTDARVLPRLAPLNDTLTALAFPAPVGVAVGFGGEPTLVSDSNGSLYLTFPGCPNDRDRCNNGPLLRSNDGGATWHYLQLDNGSLTPDGPRANGDAMVAIDAAGTLYASNLGGGIPVWTSENGGVNWTFRFDVVPDGDGADRQWAWGGPAGMVVEAWMATAPARSAAVSSSLDGGVTWNGPHYFDDPIGWIGPIAGTPDGKSVWVPYTKPLTTSPPTAGDPTGLLLVADPQVELKFLVSTDSGKTWHVETTGYVITKNPGEAQWAGTLMAPVMTRTGDGDIVYVWSEENTDPATRAMGAVAVVKSMVQTGGAGAWSAPTVLSGARTAIMPWVVGGDGGRFAVVYYAASDVHADNDYEGTWDVDITLIDGDGLATSHVAERVHTGGICARGGVCGLTLSDRSLLDFLGGTLMPDGRVAVTYASSPGSQTSGLLGSSGTTINVVVQEGGSLVARAQ